MRKILLVIAAVVLAAAGVQAQIPAEVTTVMNRCRAVMKHPDGLEYAMNMKTTMGPVTVMTIHIVSANKGEKTKSTTTMTAMGESYSFESGYDGTQAWEVKHSEKWDTITITRAPQRKKKTADLELDLDKKYKKAKMQVKDDCYVIDFSEPIDKNSEAKKVTLKVAKKNYIFREMVTKAKGAKITFTLTKLKVGLKDDYFTLNLGKYPGAVVVRE